MTNVEISAKAEDHLDGLDPQARERILKKLNEAREWTDHRIEPLANWPYYKLRTGDYRAIITWDREGDRLIVEAVGHRRNVYDRHLPPQAFLSGIRKRADVEDRLFESAIDTDETERPRIPGLKEVIENDPGLQQVVLEAVLKELPV